MGKKLTGRKRFRIYKTIFGKELVVLQVELKSSESNITSWVDAKVEHITEEMNSGKVD